MSRHRARIKILFLIDELSAGGTEKQLILLAEKLSRKYFEPFIGVLKTNKYQKKLKIRTPIVTFNLSGFRLLRNTSLIWRLKHYLDKEKFDILQLHFSESEIHGSAAAMLCRYRPILISTRRDLYHWVSEEPCYFSTGRYTVKWSDRVLANSYKVFEISQKIERIPPEKIVVIQNGVDVSKFNTIDSDEAKKILGIDGAQMVIGVVANWRPVKGLVSFLEAAALVTQEVNNSYFILAGFGSQENELKQIAGNLGIHHKVKFLKSPQNIPNVMASFDVAVQPSLSESFSNVLIEYMAAGKPIVATKVGDAAKIIENGKDGLLVQPEKPNQLSDAILALHNNRYGANKMGQIVREKVMANWSVEKMVEKYQIFYQELVGEKKR